MVKKILPVSGIIIFAILSGTVSELSSIALNLKSNMIVLMGTLICCLISYPSQLFFELFASIRQAFAEDKNDFDPVIKQIEELSAVRRTQGLFELDEKSKEIENDFLKMGIEMVADGYDRYAIFKTLERRYDNFFQAKQSQADLVNTIIKLLPVFGFVGTIIGLINVLSHMGSPEMIGKGVSTALLTTFYGLLYANIVFLPVGKKLTEKTRKDSIELALIIEGVLDIADNVNTKAIGYRLRYCIGDYYQDDSRCNAKTAIPRIKSPSFKMAVKKRYLG